MTFWERSWKNADKKRIAEYTGRLDMSEDPLTGFLKEHGAVKVCDAGCGCGAYSLKLCRHGFRVSGFDISGDAVLMTKELLSREGFDTGGFRKADIKSTGFAGGSFDAVVSREVIDHMTVKDCAAALAELLRVTRPGGFVLITLDRTDPEYESEPHVTPEAGDYLSSGGKWDGMVFHPYSEDELALLTRGRYVTIPLPCGEGIAAAIGKE